jgi:multiple antibiotic resistance protein
MVFAHGRETISDHAFAKSESAQHNHEKQASIWGFGEAMASADQLINAFTTLLVTIDPPGLAPLFLGLTVGMSRPERKQVALRGVTIAFIILAVFALFGSSVLGVLGISIGAFRLAGGLLLFWIAFEMVFEKRQDRKEKTTEVAITKDHIENIAVFPLALPPSTVERAQLIGVIAGCLLITLVVLFLADRLDRFLGVTGRAILTRLLGVILAALAAQFVVDGAKSALNLISATPT